MATEKRHRPAASTSKGDSFIIQLPTTSANENSTSHENFLDTRQELEQNNLLNQCSRIGGENSSSTQATDSVDRITHGGGPVLVENIASSHRDNESSHNNGHHHGYHHRHQHHHLNSFHNHISNARQNNSNNFNLDGARHSQTNRPSERPEQTQTDSDDQESITPPPHYHDIPGVVPAYQWRSSGPPPAYDDVVNPNAPPPSYQSLFGQVREASKTSNGLMDLLRQLFLVLIGTIGCTMIIGFLLLIPITMILIGIVYVNDCRAENIPLFLVVGGFVWIIKNMLNCYNQFKKDASSSNRPPPRRQPITVTQSSGITRQSSSSSSFESAGSSASVLIVASTSGSSSNAPSTTETSHTFAPSSSIITTSSDSRQQSTTMTTSSVLASSDASTSGDSSVGAPTTRRNYHRPGNHIRHPPMIGLTSYKCESILNYFLVVWFLAGCIVVYRIYEPDYENPTSTNYCNRIVYLYAFWLMTSAFIVMAIILSCLCCLMASSLMSCIHGR